MVKQHCIPDSIKPKFEELCEIQSNDYIDAMLQHVDSALAHLQSFKNEFLGPNFDLAEQLASRCKKLLNVYPELKEEDKRLVVGAVRYFVIHLDNLPDSTPVVGLDDDALVVNHVLETLNLKEHCILMP